MGTAGPAALVVKAQVERAERALRDPQRATPGGRSNPSTPTPTDPSSVPVTLLALLGGGLVAAGAAGYTVYRYRHHGPVGQQLPDRGPRGERPGAGRSTSRTRLRAWCVAPTRRVGPPSPASDVQSGLERADIRYPISRKPAGRWPSCERSGRFRRSGYPGGPQAAVSGASDTQAGPEGGTPGIRSDRKWHVAVHADGAGVCRYPPTWTGGAGCAARCRRSTRSCSGRCVSTPRRTPPRRPSGGWPWSPTPPSSPAWNGAT